MNNTKETKVYGKYTLTVSEWESPLGKEKNAIVGSIYRSPYSDGGKSVGGFVYGCCLSVSVDDKNDLQTLTECVEVVKEYLEEAQAALKEQVQ